MEVEAAPQAPSASSTQACAYPPRLATSASLAVAPSCSVFPERRALLLLPTTGPSASRLLIVLPLLSRVRFVAASLPSQPPRAAILGAPPPPQPSLFWPWARCHVCCSRTTGQPPTTSGAPPPSSTPSPADTACAAATPPAADASKDPLRPMATATQIHDFYRQWDDTSRTHPVVEHVAGGRVSTFTTQTLKKFRSFVLSVGGCGLSGPDKEKFWDTVVTGEREALHGTSRQGPMETAFPTAASFTASLRDDADRCMQELDWRVTPFDVA